MNAAARACAFGESQVGVGAMARALRQAFDEIDFGAVKWVDVTYEDTGSPFEALPLPQSIRGPLRSVRQTRLGLRGGPFQALFFLTQNPAVLRPHTLLRVPSLLWTDVTPRQYDEQADLYGHPVSRFAAVRRFKHTAVALAFRLAARCLAWSEWARRSLVKDYGVPEEKTEVVPPGVRLDLFTPASEAEVSRSEGPVRLLFVGGDFARKGGPQLLDLFRQRLAGRCELDLVTRAPIDPMPGVRVHHNLPPQSKELVELYRSADVFVLPTLADCHSLASLEAMASGLPVILSRFGAAPEIVEDGKSGILVEPADPGDLLQAVDSLVADPAKRREMGREGRRIAAARFDVHATATRILDHLRKVARP
jgi:glycosyltransferase involved in cell wall biosynthesis